MKKRPIMWIILSLAVTALLLAAPRVQRGYGALLFLADLGGYKIPDALANRPPVSRQALIFTAAAHHYQADLTLLIVAAGQFVHVLHPVAGPFQAGTTLLTGDPFEGLDIL